MIEQLNPVTRERSTPVTPQLAMRVAMLGVAAFVLFAIVFFRLWYLQILSGDQYRAQATSNRVRNVPLPAPRGAIVDRDGHTLVTSRQATVLQISPSHLPLSERQAAARWGQLAGARNLKPKGHHGPPIPMPLPTTPQLSAEIVRLGRVIGESPSDIQASIVQQLVVLPYAAVTIKVGVLSSERNYLLERQSEFPSIDPPSLAPVRDYPKGSLAAQLVGTIGPITKGELTEPAFKGMRRDAIIGQSGIEAQYDNYLRGVPGVQRYVVDAAGNPKGAARTPLAPQPGDQVQLTVDGGLQKSGEDALATGMNDALAFNNVAAGGAFVALDPRNGQVLALGSAPTYNPTELVGRISERKFEQLFGKNSGSPLINRAISSVYPTGSTFKPITALAALSSGKITPSDIIDDTGCQKFSDKILCDAGQTIQKHNFQGAFNLVDALRVSSDVYFYNLGARLNPLPHQPLQRVARELGLGKATGIDLPSEAGGLVPDRAWRRMVGQKELNYERTTHKPCCLYSDKRPWSVGDEINLATGQGDLEASPLQMAVAYSALANGGTVVVPHVIEEIQDAQGRDQQRPPVAPARHIKMNLGYRNVIMEGLHEAASAPGGTSAEVFQGWNQNRFPIYGKTGTAQRSYSCGKNCLTERDQSWYVAYAFDSTGRHRRPIVIAMTIEKGGFGAQAAAPAVCMMLNHWFGQHAPCKAQDSKTL
jgi:penicillin-binding protein 2